MALQTIAASDGLFAVDWEILMRLCRSSVRARSTLANSTTNVEKHLIGADLVTLDVNWDSVRHEVERDSRVVYQNMLHEAAKSMSRAAGFMQQMVAETKYCYDEFHRRQRHASRQTMQNIDRSVGRLETATEVATVVRDLSAEFLIVSAGAFTGGAGLAIGAGGGSLLKGVGKWEDTGSFSAGVLTASTELLFVALPVKFKADGWSEASRQVAGVVLAHAKGGVEIGKSIYEGKTVMNGVIAGGLKFQDPAISLIFKQYVGDAKTSPRLKIAAVAITAAVKFLRNRGVSWVQQQAQPPRAPVMPGAVVVAPKLAVLPPVPHIVSSIVDSAVFQESCVAEFGICKVPA